MPNSNTRCFTSNAICKRRWRHDDRLADRPARGKRRGSRPRRHVTTPQGEESRTARRKNPHAGGTPTVGVDGGQFGIQRHRLIPAPKVVEPALRQFGAIDAAAATIVNTIPFSRIRPHAHVRIRIARIRVARACGRLTSRRDSGFPRGTCNWIGGRACYPPCPARRRRSAAA